MADNENNSNITEENADDRVHMGTDKKHSVIDNIREMNERKRQEELEEESRRAERLAEQERAQREQYSKQLAKERIQLMKLKQGVISDEDIPKEEAEVKQYTVWQKIGNFFYHNKVYIIMAAAVAVIGGFLLYDLLSKVDPDVAVMIIARDDEFYIRTSDVQNVLEQYCEDVNGDGHILVQVSYLPAVADENINPYFTESEQTKLVAEFMTCNSVVVMADKFTCDEMKISDGVLADMREIYPDDENAGELGYMLKNTKLAEDIGYDKLADDWFIGFRVPVEGMGKMETFERNYNGALKMWDNYIKGNVVNPAEEDNNG